jgi:hypothetical protein
VGDMCLEEASPFVQTKEKIVSEMCLLLRRQKRRTDYKEASPFVETEETRVIYKDVSLFVKTKETRIK